MREIILAAIVLSCSIARADDIDEAEKLGFTEIEDRGLFCTLFDLFDGELAMADAKRTLIKISRAGDCIDDGLEVIQFVSKKVALVSGPRSSVLWLKNFGRVLEGAPMTALGFDYVAIRGTRSYTTASGVRKQAIVIEPVVLP